MKKILHLITGLEKGGGAEAMLLKTIPNLKKSENAVCAIKGKGIIGKELEASGIKVFYLEMKNYFDFKVLSRYKKILNEFHPDIQVNYLIHADIFGRIFGKKFGIKKIVSYIRNRHTEFKYSFLDRITLKKVDFLLTNSKTNLEFYRNKYNFPKNRSKCISNGIKINNNINQDNLNNLKKELDISKNEFIITCVARLHKQKSINTLIEAGGILKRENIDFKILLCGEGKEKNNLKSLVGELKLKDNVFFLGNRNDVLEILSISNVFVLSSVKEGMSNALLEAMGIGVPCIVSNIDENKELIADKKNGLTFRLKNSFDLFEKIKYIKNNNEIADGFSERSKEIIKNNYSIDKIVKIFSDFLVKF